MATEQEIKDTIKDNLIKYRKANGLTGEDVAEALNMNHGTYRSWETGRSSPKLNSIIQLSSIYNITIDKLLCEHSMLGRKNVLSSPKENNYDVYGDDYLSQLSRSEKVMIMKIRQLNQEDRAKVIELLKELLK